jgi:antitoxin component YwqK of YwqJK toxin-antitoxin module
LNQKWNLYTYLNDTVHGGIIVYNKKKKIIGEGQYHKGKREGLFKIYYKNGRIYEIALFSQGLPLQVIRFYSNGRKYEEYFLLNNKFHGFHKTYRRSGKLLYLEKYDGGELIEYTSYKRNGNIRVHH